MNSLVAPMINTFFLAFIPSISVCTVRHILAVEHLTYQDLVEDSVTSAAGVTTAASSGLGDGVQLIKEHDTWRGSPSLVEDVSNIGFRFTKPHGQELGSLDRDEVCLTLVGNA